VFMDDSDKCIIRNIIQDFYTYGKKVPTILKLLLTIRKVINFPWGSLPLHRVVKSLGFMWRKCQSKKKLW